MKGRGGEGCERIREGWRGGEGIRGTRNEYRRKRQRRIKKRTERWDGKGMIMHCINTY